jgi:hypothetical protein
MATIRKELTLETPAAKVGDAQGFPRRRPARGARLSRKIRIRAALPHFRHLDDVTLTLENLLLRDVSEFGDLEPIQSIFAWPHAIKRVKKGPSHRAHEGLSVFPVPTIDLDRMEREKRSGLLHRAANRR